MVINIHVYGFLKKKLDPQAKMSENTIISLDWKENETFEGLINRLNLDFEDLGDCFVNNTVVSSDVIIPDNARIALFGSGMRLLCGGQHLKGHGYIDVKPIKKTNYY